MHKKLDLGEIAWSKLKKLDPGHSRDYVLLLGMKMNVSSLICPIEIFL